MYFYVVVAPIQFFFTLQWSSKLKTMPFSLSFKHFGNANRMICLSLKNVFTTVGNRFLIKTTF